MDEKKYKMIISLNALNHLGINLYSNIPAVLSEIVANAWDADATRVDINFDTQKRWIEIKDNGIGMSEEDINNKFLFVGYQKRNEAIESKIFKRKFMGRKGIGKLSMFSIANKVEIITKTNDSGNDCINGFIMDVNKIKEAIGQENAENMKPYFPESINTNNVEIEKTGTIVKLTDIKKTIYSNLNNNLKKRLSRRFTIFDNQQFDIYINGDKVKYEDRDYFGRIQYLWTIGKNSNIKNYCDNETIIEEMENEIEIDNKKYYLSGWIGTAKNADLLKDGSENINKISILVRGKLALEDILNEYSEGGLYSKYLIGEINADFLDIDDEQYEDITTSSRQDLKKDDNRFVILKAKINNYLKVIQKKWTDLRNEEGIQKAKELIPSLEEWINTLKGDDLSIAKKLFGRINQLTIDDIKKKEIIKSTILAFEKFKYKNALSKIESIGAEQMEVLADVFNGIDDVEESMYYQIVSERLEVIKKFNNHIDENDLEKIVQNYLFDHLWLLDPSWERVKGTEHKEQTIERILKETINDLTPQEKDARIDLCYRIQSGKHIIIELKRANRKLEIGELIKQIDKYASILTKALSQQNIKSINYEIILVIGKKIGESENDFERAKDILSGSNCRVVFYNELITNAYNAYEEYIKKRSGLNNIVDLIDSLSD